MAAASAMGPDFETLYLRIQEGLVAIFSRERIEIAPIIEYVCLHQRLAALKAPTLWYTQSPHS